MRTRRKTEKQARRAAEQQAQLQRDIESGVYHRKLTELLDTYRAAASQQHEMEHTLAEAKAKEECISATETNLPTLVRVLAEVRDLIAGVEVIIGQLLRQQTALIEPLRAIYFGAKSEFCFNHQRLVKKYPTKKSMLDEVAGFHGIGLGGYAWPYEAFDRRIEHFTGEQVISAGLQLEKRFSTLDCFNPAAKSTPKHSLL